MRVIRAICIAFSTYSRLPMPRVRWEDTAAQNTLGALPLVGFLPGALLLLWGWLCHTLGLEALLFACVAAALPALATGGIHLDGFCDTCDALASHAPREKKLEILKDPHLGAFAMIDCAVYFLVSVGLYSELSSAALPLVACGFVLSRALCALLSVTLPAARPDGMLAALLPRTQKTHLLLILALFAAIAAGGMLVLNPLTGAVALVLCALWAFGFRALALRQFGGVTGDLSGFFLTVCELLILAAGVFAQ